MKLLPIRIHLHPTANPPRVGEHIITPSGKVYEINKVRPDTSPKTYGIGELLANLHGIKGDKGDQGPKGDRGLSIWFNKNAYGGNRQGNWWSDLYNTKVGFGPQVGDLVIQTNGMITQVTAVNANGDASAGGGTFDIGAVIGNMQGHTPVRGTDYWTDADKNEIKSYVNDAILNGKW